jgi:hypothetical protein
MSLDSYLQSRDKGKQPSPLVEVGNAFTQSQRVDVPT